MPDMEVQAFLSEFLVASLEDVQRPNFCRATFLEEVSLQWPLSRPARLAPGRGATGTTPPCPMRAHAIAAGARGKGLKGRKRAARNTIAPLGNKSLSQAQLRMRAAHLRTHVLVHPRVQGSKTLDHHEVRVTYRPRTTRTPPEVLTQGERLPSWRSGEAPSEPGGL